MQIFDGTNDIRQIGEIAAALAKAQGEMQNAPLNKVNPHFRSKYADLAAIRDAVIPALSKHGIAAVSSTEYTNGQLVLRTALIHSSGQYLDATYPLPVDNKPQVMGSAITYAKRYTLAALCQIAADEDDDANAANESKFRAGQDADNEQDAPQPTQKPAQKQIMSGPHQTATALKQAASALMHDIMGAADEMELDGVLTDNTETVEQIKRDVPTWWAGKPGTDELGMSARIENHRRDLREHDPVAAYGAG